MGTLVVVPCGKRKVWDELPRCGPTQAEEAYIGAPFKVNKQYAIAFGEKWVILSAKYGFINPDFIIPENYNVTFNDAATNPITIDRLREQVNEKNLNAFNTVVALGSTTYSNIVSKAFLDTGAKVFAPAAGLRLGVAMGKVKTAIRENKPFTT